MIRIVNWLLTRKCNLNCDYCAIVKNYHFKPKEYPDMDHYYSKEMSTNTVLNGLSDFHHHNPNCFHIFYGGEPMLRKDMAEILSFCHRHDIHYTIISNNTVLVQPLVKKLAKQVGKIRGYTASIDPILIDEQPRNSDRFIKSQQGFDFLLNMQEYCDDVVAEITVLRDDQHLLQKLVKYLTEHGINSDITFVDIAKSEYYDFANLSDKFSLVQKNPDLAYQMMNLLTDDSVDIHMKDYLIPEIYKILPSNMDCEIEKSLHNVSIDADGSVRLCLRIRGVNAPENISVTDLIDTDGNINPVANRLIIKDKQQYCKLCNHTCHLMSKVLEEKNLDPYELVHLDRRK